MCVTARAQNGTYFEGSLEVGDSLRTYLLYVPATYDGTQEWPLVVSYHGFNVGAQFQADISQMDSVANARHFLVVYPQGLQVANPFTGTSGQGWNVLGGTLSSNDDIRFTLEMIDQLSADYAIDQQRVHVTGWSMGASMTYEIACARYDRIASLAALANQMDNGTIQSCTPTRPVSMLQFHGTGDPIVPYDGVSGAGLVFESADQTAAYWASLAGCSAEPVESGEPDLVATDSSTVTRFLYEGCDSDTEVGFYRINEGGHSWPGGGALPAFLGHVNQDIDASALILEFFERNPLPESTPGVFHEGSLQVGDSLRTYLLYVPATYNGSEEWPLVLNYHGYTLDGDLQKDIDLMASVADDQRVLLAYLDGLIVDDPLDGPDTGWNFDGRVSVNDDVRFTRELIEALSSQYNVDPTRVHATGYSMGSQMLWKLACDLSDRIASVAGVGGPIDEAYRATCEPPRPIAAMLIHGTEDLFWPPEGAEWKNGEYIFLDPQETIAFWADKNGCASEPIVTDIEDAVSDDSSTVRLYDYPDCDGVETKYYNVLNGGHTWPSGSFPGGEWPDFLGFVNQDIDASAEIFAFFARNPMPDVATGVIGQPLQSEVDFALFPNPFARRLTIDLNLPVTREVAVALYNVLGQKVLDLERGMLSAGAHRVSWDGGDVPAGVYFVRVTVDGAPIAAKSVVYLGQ